MFHFWDNHGILGINARNLLYLKPLNTKERIAFADDKMRTKKYLSVRGVNTAKMLGKITSERELGSFPWESLPSDFVLKPNAGYGGEGILVIRNRESGGWLDTKGEFIPQKALEDHIVDILDGRYSITGTPDSAFFEQRLVCHPEMGVLGKFGLPDIRVIVFNLVPVMAMVRVPTKESHGKANLHMGGLGIGLDLAKGETTNISHRNGVIDSHPDFANLKGVKIPFWDEILLQATRIQQKVTLGYLAVDIVVDETLGPTLLEINARAGLSVQIANLAPLRDRLDRVSGIKVGAPEKGVRMAQDLFGNKMERRIEKLSGKKVIGMEEELTINLKHGTHTIPARMNPSMSNNYLEEGMFKRIADSIQPNHPVGVEQLTLNYALEGERGKAVFLPLPMKDEKVHAFVGKKILSNFFLDVSRDRRDAIHRVRAIDQDAIHQVPAFKSWHVIDNTLAEIDQRLALTAHLRPLNLEEERKLFFSLPSSDPQFRYQDPPENLLEIQGSLQSLSIDSRTPLGQLFEEKRQELLHKAQLLGVIGDDEHFPAIAEAFMGKAPESMKQKAKEALGRLEKKVPAPKMISSKKAVEDFQKFLNEKGLERWKAKEKEGLVSRCGLGKGNSLLVRKGEKFSETDVKKLIAHEIETHIYCTENGKQQPYQIFHRGTAQYLKTQEGLAIYHQHQVIPDGLNMAILGFAAVELAKLHSFRETFEKLKKYVSGEEAWKLTVKVKRGLSQTQKPGAFPKNALYFWGYEEISEFLEKGGGWKDLFLGKFSLHQLALIKQITGMKEAKYVPEDSKSS